MTTTTPDEIRVSCYSYQAQSDPSYIETEPPEPGKAGRGTRALPVKFRAGAFVVVDRGIKGGRTVYHAPENTPALVAPCAVPKKRLRHPGLLHPGTSSAFRTLADAKAYARFLDQESGLPADRAATHDEVLAILPLVERFITEALS